MFKKIPLILLITLVLFAPVLSLAQFPQEQPLPSAPGVYGVTSRSPLSAIVKTYVQWFIIIAAIAALVSLMYAGILYLTSAGNPGQMQTAKKRIWDSGIGLLIVFSSFLVLSAVNPSITVFNPEVKPIGSGIFLFKKDIVSKFISGEYLLVDLVRNKDVIYLTNDIGNYGQELGDFGWLKAVSPLTYDPSKTEKENTQELNFENFPIGAIGFWGLYGQRMKVLAYANPDFTSLPIECDYYSCEYKDETLPNPNRTIAFENVEISGSKPMHLYRFDTALSALMNKSYASVPFYYKDQRGDEHKKENIDSQGTPIQGKPSLQTVKHPPLSYRVLGTGPGVYLRAGATMVGGRDVPPEEKYLISSVRRLSSSDVDFDDKAKEVMLKNHVYRGPAKEEDHDYLAILHEDQDFSGNLKIFFEGYTGDPDLVNNDLKQALSGQYVPIARSYWSFLDDDPNCKQEPLNDNCWKLETTFSIDNLLPWEFSSLNENRKIGDSQHQWPYQRFGKVDNPSSVQIFEINPDYAICKEVLICTEKNFNGYCINYNVDYQMKLGANEIILTGGLPSFEPQNIPDKDINVKVKTSDGEDKKIKIEFANNIRSIKITGKCAVVLFENPIKVSYEQYLCNEITADETKIGLPLKSIKVGDYIYTKSFGESKVEEFKVGGFGFMEEQLNTFNKHITCPSHWQNGDPGSKSEVFTSSDSDLSDNNIGNCGFTSQIGFKRGDPCASAIAVYPVR